MEVRLHPDLEAKLANLAQQEGRDCNLLVVEAVEQLVDYDQWFLNEVEKGMAQIESGDTLSHEETGAQLAGYLLRKQRNA